jgi:prepilin-type processing-associated H-X9-DG protein
MINADQLIYNYGYNMSFFGANADALPRPGTTVIYGDCYHWVINTNVGVAYAFNGKSLPAIFRDPSVNTNAQNTANIRHSNGSTLGFADGHIDPAKTEDLMRAGMSGFDAF